LYVFERAFPIFLPAVGLGKEQAQADAACRFGICGIKALG